MSRLWKLARRPLFAGIALVALAAGAVYLLYAGPDVRHRSDAEMARTFRDHERDFETLLAMFHADSTVERVDVRERSLFDEAELRGNPPPARRAEYERLLRPIGVRNLFREGRDVVGFRATTVYTFDRKGYLWSRNPMSPVVERETTSKSFRSLFRVHRALKGRWYIYYQAIS